MASLKENRFDAIVIGAGASGLMCALIASERGRKVLLVDHREDFARKLIASGGGRCNFTNSEVSPSSYISMNPHFVKSALARFTPERMLAFLDDRGVGYSLEDDGKYFLTKGSKSIFEMFVRELRSAGARFVVSDKLGISKPGDFLISAGDMVASAPKIVVATGGLSFQALGATGLGHKIAKKFGHSIVSLHPGLVPYVIKGPVGKFFAANSGASLICEISLGRRKFRGELLMTHSGISGPAAIRSSSFWNAGESLSIDFLPDIDFSAELISARAKRPKLLLKNFLSSLLPEKIAFAISRMAVRVDKRIADMTSAEMEKTERFLKRFEFVPAAVAGYEKADVTIGGVDTSEISSKTMESLKEKGLYFIGELLDVAGDLGGYNLHWAWASGFAAGVSI